MAQRLFDFYSPGKVFKCKFSVKFIGWFFVCKFLTVAAPETIKHCQTLTWALHSCWQPVFAPEHLGPRALLLEGALLLILSSNLKSNPEPVFPQQNSWLLQLATQLLFSTRRAGCHCVTWKLGSCLVSLQANCLKIFILNFIPEVFY